MDGGVIVGTEKRPGNVEKYPVISDFYEDIYGNFYEYSDSFFGRKKIIKNGTEIVFIESRFNQIATAVKQWQFFEVLLAIALFGGRGHPIVFIKVAAKRIADGKRVYLTEFDRYYREYYSGK